MNALDTPVELPASVRTYIAALRANDPQYWASCFS
jgi:hypothetical protein